MLTSSEEQNMNNVSNASDSSASRANRIRELNDRLRTTGRGGIVMVTNGIAALDPAAVIGIFDTVRSFTGFDDANDRYGEHDCAGVDVDGNRILWKIDYYDRSRRFGSPDPADPKVTVRVLTVMLAEEY